MPAEETPELADPRGEWTTFLRTVLGLTAVFAAGQTIGVAVLGSRTLASLTAILVVFLIVGAVAGVLARRGMVERSASTIGHAILAASLAATVVAPFVMVVAALATLMTVAGVLRFLRGRALAIMLASAGMAEIAIVLVGVLRPGHDDVPQGARLALVVAATASTAFVALYMLWRFSTSLRTTLDRVVEANAALRASESRFRALTDERARVLEREKAARRDAEEASRIKEEFLLTVSHELRTPLTAILGWARLARTGQGETERAIETIDRNARVQARIIDDLLDASRMTTGKLRLDLGQVDVARVARAAIEVIRPTAEAKALELVFHADGAAETRGDPERLQQVVWNLLSNAVKFTPAGGTVTTTVTARDGVIRVAVEDTGAGVAPDLLPHVFERFRQGDSSTTRSHGGLGLGLAIVRHLVEAHGGSVDVRSAGVGRGATFSFQLPVVAQPARGSAALRESREVLIDSARAGRVLEGARVLVVDDDRDTLDLLAVVLQTRGAEVRTATGAADALAVLDEFRPDAIVSDIGMPGADGFALLSRIRERSIVAPALALTAYAREEDRERALAGGFQAFVPKPIDPLQLVASVVGLLRSPIAA
jgi:signal transduction histidine kinase/CheY-like chemotaxis protein